MNNSNRKSSLRKSNDCIFRKSPSVSLKSSVRESKIDHLVGVNLEQKLHTFRTRMLGSLSSHESQSSIPTPVVVPLKPMPYVRCFNVTVSLKKSRLLSRRSSNAKQWSIGKKQFNDNPKEGYRWLVDNNLIENTSEHMAAFLLNEIGLSKRAIGEFLGENDNFHIEVLNQYGHMHDFISKDIVEALRIFLYKFILPGEAQKIERIMTVFAQRYYECNPDMFANSDVCFILSYAIIMLNTSLHNKNAKMGGPFTFDMFLNSLNGTKEKEFMPETSVIKHIYDNIKNRELKFPDDEMNLTNINARIREGDSTIIKEGWLWKQGGRVKNWKRRWFVLVEECLYYFDSRTDIDNIRGMIPLIDIGIREIDDDRQKAFCFELFPLAGEKVKSSKAIANETGRMTEGNHSVYRMSATTEDEQKEWIRVLRFASQNDLPKPPRTA